MGDGRFVAGGLVASNRTETQKIGAKSLRLRTQMGGLHFQQLGRLEAVT